MKYKYNSSGSVSSILIAAAILGIAIGLPLGYLARLSAEQPSSPNVALLQQGNR
ncbi:MAG TPA: hypothetical protein V6D50_11120 [Chroococcales cyanobacterium]|jgi:hypothetical protein